MKIAFWSEDDGCGTTSAMAAVASVCSNAWNIKTVLMQSRGLAGDLCGKFECGALSGMVREESAYYALDGLDYLLWQEKNNRLDTSAVRENVVAVVKDKMFYLPQGRCSSPYLCRQDIKGGMLRVAERVEQIADFMFLDCGCGKDEMTEDLLAQADVVAVNLSQERESVEACFERQRGWRGKVVYIINRYRQESVYNRKNISRIYRLCDGELCVVPEDLFFGSAGDKGQLERFVRRHLKSASFAFDPHQYFMRELTRTAGLILRAAGYAE